jgi:hemerythrin-like domain-containing protein
MLHLDAEETVLFPMAEEYLEEDDWAEIEEQVEPIRGSYAEGCATEYDRLLRDILNFEL